MSNLEIISITALRILLMKIFPASEPAFSPEKGSEGGQFQSRLDLDKIPLTPDPNP